MNIGAIITATVVVAAVGLFIGIFLSVAGKKFAVETDEREVAVREALPGNNCGGCGYPGCDGLAAAIAKGEAPVNACPVGGEAVGKVIAGIMGQEVVESTRMAAFVKCTKNFVTVLSFLFLSSSCTHIILKFQSVFLRFCDSNIAICDIS